MEIFKDIKNYEGVYQISNFGNVRSLDRQSGKGFLKGKPLKVWSKPKKYSRVTLEHKNKKASFCVHRLVALHFIPNPLQKSSVNHIDGNKNNANVNNLEWVTLSENMQHAFDTGLLKNCTMLKGLKGESSPSCKLSDIDVLMIKCLHNNGFNYKMIAKRFNVHSTQIGNIIKLKSRNND